jgi:hypothetical protein
MPRGRSGTGIAAVAAWSAPALCVAPLAATAAGHIATEMDAPAVEVVDRGFVPRDSIASMQLVPGSNALFGLKRGKRPEQ